MSKPKAQVHLKMENTFGDITNLAKANTTRHVQGSKPNKKKKSKVMVMKKKAPPNVKMAYKSSTLKRE